MRSTPMLRALILVVPLLLAAVVLTSGAGRSVAAQLPDTAPDQPVVAELPPPSGPDPAHPLPERNVSGTPVQPTPPAQTGVSALDEGNPDIGKGFTMALLGNNGNVSSMGFNWVAYTVDWGTSEPSQGNYNWGDVNNIVNSISGTSLRLLLRIGQSPAWANNANTHGWYPPRDANDFGNFAGRLAAHVRQVRPDLTVAYEMWNEPNLGDNWGCQQPSPAYYAAMTKAAYIQIKNAAPSATVVAGGVTTVGALDAAQSVSACPHIDDLAFIRGMYDAGAQPYFDVLSDHPYGFGDAPEAEPRTVGRTLVFRRAELHREIMIQRGDAGKQIWATEMGWPVQASTDGCTCTGDCWYFIFTQQQQADYLVRAYQWARSYWSWMGAMFIFNYDFKEAPWYGQCDSFRFFSVKGRPAESALRNFAFSPPPTYTPRPTSTPTPTRTPTTVVTPTPTIQPDAPPRINALRASPLAFGSAGGNVNVQVDAADNDQTPIEFAQATLTFPNGGTQVFPMTLQTGTSRDGTWAVDLTIDPNTSGNLQVYRIDVCVVEVLPTRGFACAAPVTITSQPYRFADVPGDFWAYTPIEYLASHNIVSGYADASFRPNSVTTRGQFSKMVVLAAGWPVVNPSSQSFADVTPSNPFYGFIETAFAHGVISGYADSSFRPFENITRAQIAKIIALAEQWSLEPPKTATFRDVPLTFWGFSFIEAAVERGVVSGYGCGGSCLEFRPNTNATRAQLSKMLYGAILYRSVPTATPTLTRTPTQTPVITSTPTATARASATATSTAPAQPTSTPSSTPALTATPTITPPTNSTPTPTPTSFIIP